VMFEQSTALSVVFAKDSLMPQRSQFSLSHYSDYFHHRALRFAHAVRFGLLVYRTIKQLSHRRAALVVAEMEKPTTLWCLGLWRETA